jgi:hypothetical protein
LFGVLVRFRAPLILIKKPAAKQENTAINDIGDYLKPTR